MHGNKSAFTKNKGTNNYTCAGSIFDLNGPAALWFAAQRKGEWVPNPHGQLDCSGGQDRGSAGSGANRAGFAASRSRGCLPDPISGRFQTMGIGEGNAHSSPRERKSWSRCPELVRFQHAAFQSGQVAPLACQRRADPGWREHAECGESCRFGGKRGPHRRQRSTGRRDRRLFPAPYRRVPCGHLSPERGQPGAEPNFPFPGRLLWSSLGEMGSCSVEREESGIWEKE